MFRYVFHICGSSALTIIFMCWMASNFPPYKSKPTTSNQSHPSLLTVRGAQINLGPWKDMLYGLVLCVAVINHPVWWSPLWVPRWYHLKGFFDGFCSFNFTNKRCSSQVTNICADNKHEEGKAVFSRLVGGIQKCNVTIFVEQPFLCTILVNEKELMRCRWFTVTFMITDSETSVFFGMLHSFFAGRLLFSTGPKEETGRRGRSSSTLPPCVGDYLHQDRSTGLLQGHCGYDCVYPGWLGSTLYPTCLYQQVLGVINSPEHTV